MREQQILIVEDDSALRRFEAAVLEAEGYEVTSASNAAEARQVLATGLFDVALLDIALPDGSGLDLLRALRDKDVEAQVVMVTASQDIRAAVEALRMGAADYLLKPVHAAELTLTVKRLVERNALRDEVRTLRTRLGERLAAIDLVAVSPAMRAVRDVIERVAPTDSTVIIEGETGTGKEVVAALLHRLSSRREKPFIPVNCGAIPSELAESEFFGHVRGAFSGAVNESPGLVRSAHGGTLFLDEVSELPLPLQVKLLRVLQDREVRPVGAPRPVPVDVRLVAASNRGLAREVERGRFRQDLYYRLNVVSLTLPPLRSRREDLPALCASFVRQYNRRFARRVKSVSPEAMAALAAWDFPGNVRELEHMIERAFALGASEDIRLADLPTFAPIPEPGEREDGGTSDLGPLERAERQAIMEALLRHGNEKDAAAAALGISRRTLYRRIRDFGLA